MQETGPQGDLSGNRPAPSLLRWLALTVVGFLMGALMGGVLEFLIYYRPTTRPTGLPASVSGVQVIPLGLAVGAAWAAGLQSRQVPEARSPIAWTATGVLAGAVGLLAAAAAAAGLLAPVAIPPFSWFPVVAAIGLAQAFTQALLWRERPRWAMIWFAATVLVWAVSGPMGWIGGLMFGVPLAMVVSLVAGGVVGGIVGAAMIVVVAGFVQGLLLGALLVYGRRFGAPTDPPSPI